MKLNKKNQRVEKDALMGAALIVDRLTEATALLDADERMRHDARDGMVLSATLRAAASGRPVQWPNMPNRRHEPFQYERPDGGHDQALLAALRTMQDAVAAVAAVWSGDDYAVLGTSYGLPLDFAEIALAVAGWEIPHV